MTQTKQVQLQQLQDVLVQCNVLLPSELVLVESFVCIDVVFRLCVTFIVVISHLLDCLQNPGSLAFAHLVLSLAARSRVRGLCLGGLGSCCCFIAGSLALALHILPVVLLVTTIRAVSIVSGSQYLRIARSTQAMFLGSRRKSTNFCEDHSDWM